MLPWATCKCINIHPVDLTAVKYNDGATENCNVEAYEHYYHTSIIYRIACILTLLLLLMKSSLNTIVREYYILYIKRENC